MRWPSFWEPSTDNDPSKRNAGEKSGDVPHSISSAAIPAQSHPASKLSKSTDWNSILTAHDWQAYTEARNLIPIVLLTSACIGFYAFYQSYLRRIPAAGNISPGFFRRRSILGRVTSVGDGDNFRVYHTPGGWLTGWGWLPWRRVPVEKKELKNKTIHVRLAGVDAPEAAHFGRPAQPFSKEALDWLTSYVLGRRVRAYVYKPDQYGRVVATVYVWKWLLRRDVGLQMLKSGLATVYEAKAGAEFGVGLEERYRKAEWWAKMRRKGMWACKKDDFESPREYKARYGGGSGVEHAGRIGK